MPHHPKKSATNALKNGSPRAEKKKKHVFPEPASVTSPSVVTTNYQEIHQNEVEALRSIYGDDFEEVQHRPSAWHQSSEVSFKLHLRASSNPDVRLDLLVSLPTTYPKTCPNITPENLEDLRRGAQSRVRDILRNKPKTLLGSEMIYELGVSIQDVLEDAAEAQAHDQDLPSLEEERMVQEAAATERAERAKEEELRAQQAATAKEEQELQLLLQNTIRERTTKARLSRRKSKASGLETNGDTDGVLNLPGAITFDPPLVMSDTDEGPLLFRAVFGKTLLHSAHGVSTFVVRPTLPANRPCAPLLVLKELSVDEKKVDALAFREEMRSSEDRLEGLKKLRHPNLVEFIGFKILSPLDHTKDSLWTVFALVEYANKGSLSELLDMAGTVAIEMLRSWTIQLLEALEYYHRNGFVHGDIHCGRVLLFRNPTGGTIVKLLSSIEGALPDPANSKRSLTTSKSPFWLPPELTQERSSPTMKTDVWDLGIVFLQMGFGSDVLQRYTSANALMVALDLSPSLQDLLQEFFRPNPKRRPTAFQLQPSEFFRIDSPLLMRSSASNSMSQSKRPRLESISAGVPSFSRYNQDFDEAGRLGKGGFGEVVKARNKLDGRFYAIKKISHKSTTALKDTLFEIMLLSRLNHPYVVRYYTAWLEEDYGQQNEEAVSFTAGNSFASTRSKDFDYSTTGGLDFISSSGYPNIEFANDSDEDDCGTVSTREKGETPETYGTESSTGRELSRVRSGSQGKPTLTTLYIQMEYCERHTLRDLIKNGLYDDVDRSWRLFRQILDGLTHIHGHGIIHRDLKPDNIFIDAANNPRIGDFGLATSGQFTTAVRSSAAADFEGNLTRSLGTTYYVAPEMKSGFSGHYNEKVDMYSMGVIFFEMCHSLPTNMERDQTLRVIREKHHILPATFKSSEKAVQGKIIESLLNHNPGERPSASELLQSGQIPLQVEEETFRRAIMHLLSDPASPDYKKILSAIFSQSPKKFEDIAWDVDSHKAPAANELLVRGLVKERLTSIFRRHGAVEATRQMLFPKSQHYKSGAVRLLDASGNALQLPFDLTLPNARAISRQDPSLEKTFTFGTVYRETPHGGEPRTHKEVDFDIVSRNTLDLALKEAEVIKVLDEVIEEFPPLRASPMCFLINHSDLLQLIMEFCRITPSQIPLVKEVISRLNVGKWPMQKIRSELRSPAIGVASTSLDDLARFDFRDTPRQTQKRLRDIMEGTEFAERLTPIFARINSVISYLQGFEVKRKVYINPLGSLNDKFFRGSILFQCIFDSKRREVFAAGGRYDSLVQDFRPTVLASRSQTHAVGFNLSWDMLSALMIEYLKAPMRTSSKYLEAEVGAFWKTRRCDVLVASFDPTVLREMGVKLTQDLWANDISAELAVDASSLEELLVKYKEHNHSWIVIAKQDSKERGFKVRCLVPKEEFDIRNTELIPWLRNEIRARNTREGAMDNSRYSRLSQSEANAAVNERANDVRILVSQHRSKKTNRRNIVESALLRSREVVEKALDGPIAAIDTRDDLLEAIRDTRLSDPDSWRAVIQNAPLTERKYLGQVQDLLTDLASESRAEGTETFSNAFIYNFRTGSCINYDLKTGNDR